jgi:hypothetical protein
VPLLPPSHGELRRRSVLLPSQSLHPLLTSSLCAGTCPGSPLTTPLSSLTEASWCAGETRLLRRCAVSEHRRPVYLARRMCDTLMNPPAKLCLSFSQRQHVASHTALICVCMCGAPDRARAASGRVPAPRHATLGQPICLGPSQPSYMATWRPGRVPFGPGPGRSVRLASQAIVPLSAHAPGLKLIPLFISRIDLN